MTSEGLGEMIEGDTADTACMCFHGTKCPLLTASFLFLSSPAGDGKDGKFPDLVQVLHLHVEHQAGHVAGFDEEGRNVGHLGGPA